MQRRFVTYVLISCVVLAAVPAMAPASTEAAKAFEKGQALLVKADFEGALKAFKSAAKTDSDNAEYRQTHAIVRQVIRIRGMIEEENDSQKWLPMAQALRSFYHEHGIYTESLPLDRKIHKEGLTDDCAAMLAETLIALDKDGEVVELLEELGEKETTARTNVLLGLAIAREGDPDKAKALAAKVGVKADADRELCFDLARLRARISDSSGMVEALTRSFELTPPSQLDAFKASAKTCKDLAAYADTSGFAKALKTKSQVKESKCSGGTGCGKCPNRGGCGSKAGKPGDKSKGGKSCDKPCDKKK
jgi:hypothetical protein